MAIINIGSGSVKLFLESCQTLEARVTLLASYANKKDMTALDDTFNAVAFFCKKAANLGENIRIFGTESMRQIDDTLAKRIFDELNLVVDIISGEEEALCGFLGCLDSDNQDSNDNNQDSDSNNQSLMGFSGGNQDLMAVIDVGGASTEISMGKYSPEFCLSLPIGSVALFNHFGIVNNPSSNFFPLLYDYIDNALAPIRANDFSKLNKIKLIGGGATNLAAMLLNLSVFDAAAIEGYTINIDILPRFIHEMFDITVTERVQKYPFLEEKRALVLPYGVSIIYRLLSILPKVSATVNSRGDLIEGYIRLKQTN